MDQLGIPYCRFPKTWPIFTTENQIPQEEIDELTKERRGVMITMGVLQPPPVC